MSLDQPVDWTTQRAWTVDDAIAALDSERAAHAATRAALAQATKGQIAAELDATVARQQEAHTMVAYRSARQDVEQAEHSLAQATTQTCETCKFKGTAGGNLDVNWCALWKQTVPDQVTGCKGYQALPAPPKLTTQGDTP
jgi:hypothetical protein